MRIKLAFAGAALLFVAFVAFGQAAGQSSDVNFPTPLSSNKLTGTIRARDIGDNRLTTHYFVFNGTQGDLFVNVVSSNLDADIDVFSADGLIPLAKMIVASDAQANETGRLIYLRRPEKLILRIQGRTPNDLPASYQVSFGGSFVAITGEETQKAPVVESGVKGDVAVNSVGTILPQAKETTAPAKEVSTEEKRIEIAEAKEPRTDAIPPAEAESPKKADASETKATKTGKRNERRRPKVVVTENIEPKKEETAEAEKKKPAKRKKTTAQAKKKPDSPKAETPPAVDPLANVKLVILFKNGEKVEIGMPDLLRFTVDKGQLIVIRKTGSIDRYSMLEVAKVTIE